jgi:trigger factor
MKIDTLDIKGCNREIFVEFSWEEVDQKVNNIAKDIRKIAVIDGFRPGKVPINHIKRVFAKQIKEEVIKDVVPKAIDSYLTQEKLMLASEPQITNLVYAEQCPLTFNILMEILPNIEPKDYRGIEISRAEIIVSESEIEERIDELRRAEATLEPITEREAREGDYVGIKILSPQEYFREKIDSNEIYRFFLGASEVKSILNDLVMGMKLNEVKETAMPQGESRDIALAVQLVEIKEMKLASIEDLYKNKEGITNLEEFKDAIRRELINKKEKNQDEVLKEKIIEHILEANNFDVPNSYIDDEKHVIFFSWINSIYNKGIYLPIWLLNYGNKIEEIEKEAVRKVKRRFILDAIAKAENIDIDDEYINKKIEKYASEAGQNVVVFKAKFQARSDYKYILEEWRREKVLDFLLQDAKII